jgi:hypothetical protein
MNMRKMNMRKSRRVSTDALVSLKEGRGCALFSDTHCVDARLDPLSVIVPTAVPVRELRHKAFKFVSTKKMTCLCVCVHLDIM